MCDRSGGDPLCIHSHTPIFTSILFFFCSLRECTGMSELAYNLLTTEDSAEWVCDKCIANKYIPTVKMVPTNSWVTKPFSLTSHHTHSVHLIYTHFICLSEPMTHFLSLFFFNWMLANIKNIQIDWIMSHTCLLMSHSWMELQTKKKSLKTCFDLLKVAIEVRVLSAWL